MTHPPAPLSSGLIERVDGPVPGADVHRPVHDGGGALDCAAVEPELLGVQGVAFGPVHLALRPGAQIERIDSAAPGADYDGAVVDRGCGADPAIGLGPPVLLAGCEIE